VGYCIRYMNGVLGDTDRGRLVAQFNSMTEGSDAFMYLVAGLGLVCGLLTARFAFRKFHE